MTPKESFRERQIHELEAIKSIFGSDAEDLRPSSNAVASASQWKPTDVRILLSPLRDSSNKQTSTYVRTKLRIVCPSKYPKVPPRISLEETKNISDTLVEELLQQLHQQSMSLRGEVMIYELTQTVQAFLCKHNKPPRGSCYDEMIEEKRKQLNLEREKEILKRQTFIEEVERRKKIFKSETRRRGDLRRSMSESNRPGSSSDSSECSLSYVRSYMYPNKCMEHRNTETLYFPKVGRQIKRGCCLGHSQKGCVAYTGVDLDSGQLLYITEWNIRYSRIEQKCNSGKKCLWGSTESNCRSGHRVDDITAAIEKQVANLAQLHHKNLIQYECVLCIKRKEGVLVYLVQDFVLGTSLYSISTALGWCVEGARMVASGILDALVFLHNKGVSHNILMDTTVFMDNTGNIRCTDFSLVPNLLELTDAMEQKPTRGDLPALGMLIDNLLSTTTLETKDFVDKCKSDRTLSASELLDHPFLRCSLFTHEENDCVDRLALAAQPPPSTILTAESQRNQIIGGQVTISPLHQQRVQSEHPLAAIPTAQLRINTEFQFLTYLGKGAFGDVLKVRNILDNREYAIKRIPLPARSRQLYKKMTREVELLSRLNHENVVRYFNSWIESAQLENMHEIEKMMSGEWSLSHRDSVSSPISAPRAVDVNGTDECSSNTWGDFMDHVDDDDDDDSDSDGIEFVNSNGETAVYDTNVEEEQVKSDKVTSPRPPLQIMYIQMEFCDKSTLRTAIDDNLYENEERLWRLFREIAEGLSHIHQQGIIHRDLKPVNIFLDSHDQIKIGDFGLATTSFLALQCQGEQRAQPFVAAATTDDGTGTGKVGTTLYVAPELTENASKSTYNQKVDMYTLGIILFEMMQPPFGTCMERTQTIMALRCPAIIVPTSMMDDVKFEKSIKIIYWLLDHDPSQRPTAEELLASDLVPPIQLEGNELQEMLRNALANPQSKAYKHLVARCLQQECDEVLEHTYHLDTGRAMRSWTVPIVLDGLVSVNPVFDFVKAKVTKLFRKHGAIEVDTPLLSPFSRNVNNWLNPVKLMTHSGCVAVLPSELRTQFARQVATSGVNFTRRYCIGRVYREEKVFNFHPKQNYECYFDIITPNSGTQLADAELLSVAFEIIGEMPRLRDTNIFIRMNHTHLLRAILIYFQVPKTAYRQLFANLLDYIEGRISKFQFHSSVTLIMGRSKSSASALLDLLLSDFVLGGSRSNVDESSLKSLIRGKGEAATLAKAAIRELEMVASLAQSLGVTYPMHVFAGLSIGFERASSGGIVWQMLADLKPNRMTRPTVLAVGGRYDNLLQELQKKVQNFNANTPQKPMSGAGLSVSLDKLIAAIGTDCAEKYPTIDVGICVSGSRPPLKDVTHILRLFWSLGLRCGVVEGSCSADEAQDLAKQGARHVVLVSENGALRIRSWDHERFHERHVTSIELIDYIHKMARVGHTTTAALPMTLSHVGGPMASGATRSTQSLSQLPKVQVVFVTHDKLNTSYKRRYENQVAQQMSTTLLRFVKKESFVVFVVDMAPALLGAMVGAINPRNVKCRNVDNDMSIVIERFPTYKRYITQIFDEILEYVTSEVPPIMALYSTSHSFYRVIL